MLFTYAPAVSQTQRDAIFLRMQAEGLLNCAMSALAAPTLADWRRITSPRRGLLLCCHAAEEGDSQSKRGPATQPRYDLTASPDPDGPDSHMVPCGLYASELAANELAAGARSSRAAQRSSALVALSDAPDPDAASILGCALFTPRRGKVWEFDCTTFRPAAHLAVSMARGGLAWAFAHLDCAAVAGLCPAPNRHAWRLAEACGFHVMGRLPQACWHARKQRHVDGVLVLCTPNDLAKRAGTENAGADPQSRFMRRTKRNLAECTIKEAVMGFGGGYSSPSVPEVTPVPKQEVQKPVTEAATAARQAQKDKASKAAGINASVYTSPLNRADATQKTLLGQ